MLWGQCISGVALLQRVLHNDIAAFVGKFHVTLRQILVGFGLVSFIFFVTSKLTSSIVGCKHPLILSASSSQQQKSLHRRSPVEKFL